MPVRSFILKSENRNSRIPSRPIASMIEFSVLNPIFIPLLSFPVPNSLNLPVFLKCSYKGNELSLFSGTDAPLDVTATILVKAVRMFWSVFISG